VRDPRLLRQLGNWLVTALPCAAHGRSARQVKSPASATAPSRSVSIGRSKHRAADLSTKNREFVAKHHDLEFLEVPGAAAECDELEQASQSDVGKRSEQARPPVSGDRTARLYGGIVSARSQGEAESPSPAFVRPIEFAHPTGFEGSVFGLEKLAVRLPHNIVKLLPQLVLSVVGNALNVDQVTFICGVGEGLIGPTSEGLV
jgi:hypothetical protein